MFEIILQDGTRKTYQNPVTIYQIFSESFDASHLKKIVAARIAGKLFDLSTLIKNDTTIEPITYSEPEGLEILRHSTAHLLAHAILELFPDAEPVIGPVIDDGFYYDFYYPAGFSESDLEKIENKMRELVEKNLHLERMVKSRTDAMLLFSGIGESYKEKIIEELPPEVTEVSLYQQGNFIDLCRGPHVYSTGQIKAFKLTKLSGAYWHGDSKNEILQRIYGTAWPTKLELEDYLHRLEQAKLRDHRLIGKKMDLFHLQDEAPGLVFWHPNGWAIYKEIKHYIANKLVRYGYQEINTPQILDRTLWEKSGHGEKYSSNMFITESENRIYALKPMNCPGHIQVFKQGIKSYRDLPIRYAEFGCCHRNEPSGTLHGILRVRGFVQDDGHILCTEDQIISESVAYIDQLREVYTEFGFTDLIVKLATRPAKRIGSDEIWDKAEQTLAAALNLRKVNWKESPGDGAFYGPKIEFSLRDSLGRIWQCGTLQVDYFMPERLGAFYIAEDGSKKTPVMLHRAMLGAIERFLGILLEETGGDLPLWLAPVQAVGLNITDNQRDYVSQMIDKLQIIGLRVKSDLRNEKISFKIREHSIQRTPYLLIVGDRELESGTISVRNRAGVDLGKFTFDRVVELLTAR